MNNFTIDMAAKSKLLNSKSFLRLYIQNMMCKIRDIKSKEPRLTQKQIFIQLGYSDSTIKQYRDDIQMDSPYKREKYMNKSNKSNSTITQSQIHAANGSPKNNRSTKSKKKNDPEGGNPNNISDKELIEQVFSKDSRDDNTKFITIARKMVENV